MMKFFILDWLVCPHDRYFPLNLVVDKVMSVKNTSYIKKCKFYCSRYLTSKVDNITEIECKDCFNFNIESGVLRCPSCNKNYPVIDGIPDMVYFDNSDPVTQVKIREIDVRDREAPLERKFYSDYMWFGEIPPVLKLLRLSEDEVLLDLGCGSGRFTELYSKRCLVFAVDFSFRALQECKKKSGEVNLHPVRANIEHLPFLDNRFNKIVSTQVLSYFPQGSRFKSYEEIHRVLNQKGFFIMTVYNYNLIKRRDRFPKEFFSDTGIYNFYFTKEELISELRSFFVIEFFGGILHFVDIGTSLALKLKTRMRIIDSIIEKTPLSSLISFLHLVKCMKS